MEIQDAVAYVGIDWADDKHAICLMDPNKQEPEDGCVEQSPEAIDEWVAQLQRRFPNQKVAICLEQKRGALIYALMKFDNLILVPINPRQLARFRQALGSSEAKDDPTDARLLAELLCKHADRLRPWCPDDEATRKIGLLSEDRRHLVDERTRLTHCLKSCLKQYFPLALQVAGDRIFGNLACQFLKRYPTLEQLQSSSDDELRQFYWDHGCHRQHLIDERLKAIRQAKPLTTDRAIVESGVLKVRTIVAQILVLNTSIDEYDEEISSLMRNHQDAEIFESFPGAGAAMAPRLLAALGSDRDRLASAQELQQLSGIAPVTKRSGKSTVVHRRWACNRFLLQTFHEFAAHSIRQSDWAKAYYDMYRANGRKHQAAVRALAFKWIRIIFRCWKNRTTYDELAYSAALIKRKSPILEFLASNPEKSGAKP
jgi:transposase